jgi:hypothetical protein
MEFKVVVAAAAPADERSLRISFIVYNEHGSALKNTHVAYTPKRDGLLLKKLNRKMEMLIFFLFIYIYRCVCCQVTILIFPIWLSSGWTFFFRSAGRGEN